MGEKSLHEAIKRWYARPNDNLEVEIDKYIVDIVRNDLLIEIQTHNFSSIKAKLVALLNRHPVKLVHPISEKKWIVRVGTDGKTVLSKRKSPKKGRVENLFSELVYMPDMVKHPDFSLEILFIHSEEILINDGRGSWRRKGWSIHDSRLVEVVSNVTFSAPSDFDTLLPSTLPTVFTSLDLAKASRLRLNDSRRMLYCLRHMGTVQVVGKRGRTILYSSTALSPR
jgi:hypothetical protein